MKHTLTILLLFTLCLPLTASAEPIVEAAKNGDFATVKDTIIIIIIIILMVSTAG